MQSSIQPPSIYQPLFAFSQPQFKHNKLINKEVPAVQVDTNLNIVKCKDSDAQVAIVKAQNPLPTLNVLSFFEVQILKCSSAHSTQCGVNVGLITKDGNPRAYAGKYMNSIGYFNGQIYLNKKKIATGPHLSKKDRIGCGINCSNMSFFFTKNTQIIASDIALPQGSKWNQFFPAVALQHQQQTVKCHFERKDFVFDVDTYGKSIQQEVKQQIFNQESDEEQISSSDIYSLISEYMLFNGYSKTLELMKQKKEQIQFEPINKLTKNIKGTKLLINLDQQSRIKEDADQLLNLQAVSDDENDNTKQKKFIQQQIVESKLKNRMRQRIMSDVSPGMLQQQSQMVEQADQPRRKNTEAMGQDDVLLYEQMRKQSNISNISLVDQESEHNNKEAHLHIGTNQEGLTQANLFQQSLTLNERFLLKERLQILSLIKQSKIQCAQKIIKQKIPKLYEIEPLLQAYLKAHIFLRKIKEEGPIPAIKYCNEESSIKNSIDKLFPTYDSVTGNIEMIPMKKILTSIISKGDKAEERRFLQKQQFEYFAQYINSLIMKSMGVMGNSRLGVILEHTTIVLRKLQQFKGMSCGVKLLG